MINIKRALQIVSELLNGYLNDPDIHITEEEKQAVILIMDLAEESNRNIQDSCINLN